MLIHKRISEIEYGNSKSYNTMVSIFSDVTNKKLDIENKKKKSSEKNDVKRGLHVA
jgi:hypothetical protein